ncbi:hypothetical protein GOP47_0030934 [Adiantum capillus-veneris]|nr:hypothetical protein GOP47_0030934 [Adiantum capillus-veneris]
MSSPHEAACNFTSSSPNAWHPANPLPHRSLVLDNSLQENVLLKTALFHEVLTVLLHGLTQKLKASKRHSQQATMGSPPRHTIPKELQKEVKKLINQAPITKKTSFPRSFLGEKAK